MLGAGVFVAFAPAAAAAGAWLLLGLLVAALVASANAISTAQLAARNPRSGGAYVFGRERLGPWPGFVAGWAFVAGKVASCAAMALAAASYLVPEWLVKPLATTVVVLLTAVNLAGITRTAAVTRVLLGIVLAILALVVTAGAVALGASGFSFGAADAPAEAVGPSAVLGSAGVLFFAFAGYARVATLGEEVREPERTIPRAVIASLLSALVVYAVVGGVALAVLGPSRLAGSTAPLVDVVTASGWSWCVPLVRAGAAVAALGALLALIAGIGRTAFAMAREGDLPRSLAVVRARTGVPHRAEVAAGLGVILLVWTVDLGFAIVLSSFSVLVYYLVADLAAFTQPSHERLAPRVVQVFGVVGCAVLAVTLPWQAIVLGGCVLAAGLLVRAAVLVRRRGR
ncbi:APC family permease [Pseudoclavibacter chungangensis]|uniref:APC family permease n=2 Tax=Pseudoclavibacter chungangensis TaxID=587635 RepID=A0A7J5BM51_9MICO|nr:APC family permease [Pseudoclavibacter chungangensis]